MRFALMIEAQQGLSYEDQLAIARRAEAAGFEAMFRSDHYASFPGDSNQVTTDAWAVLAGLARETSAIRLGALVSPVTFRHPGNFVKLVTTVDHMSGGRVEVGVGAGWNDEDHLPHGLAFPPIDERADLMEDQLALLHGLWEEPEGWDFDGLHVTVRGGRLVPGPVQREDRPIGKNGRRRPWILTGGGGSPRGYRMAARWADEFNLTSSSPDDVRRKEAELDEACRTIGRDPRHLVRSAMVGALVGRDEAALGRRAAALLAGFGDRRSNGREWLEERRSRWILGTPDEARATARAFGEAGVERIMLQDFVPRDLDHIDELAEALIGMV